MSRRARGSLCWDSIKSEVVDLYSDDLEFGSDDDVPKRTVRTKKKAFQEVTLISSDSDDGNLKTPRRNARRQFRILSDDDESDDEVQITTAPKPSKFGSDSDSSVDVAKARKATKFRIDSDGSDTDDCVIYSSDEETSTVVSKIKQLTLPKFSYDTPDKRTNLKNRKLLKDISNHCGTPLRSSIFGEANLPKSNDVIGAAPTRKSKDGRRKSDKQAENNRLFDSLLGIDYKNSDPGNAKVGNQPNLSPIKIMALDSYMDTVRTFDAILQRDKGGKNAKKTECEPSGGGFKKPTTFKKQKQVSSRMKRPGDSKIVSRRTDDSDSTSTDQQISSSVENLTELPKTKLPKPKVPLSWEYEPIDIPSDPEELYAKESPRPPIRKKGKTTNNFCFADLSSALDEIEAQGRVGEQKSFLSSLDSTVEGSTCHPTAQFYKEKFAKKKEELAAVLFRIFNKDVFESKLPDGMVVDWSGRMTSSAGITHLSRKMVGGQWAFLARITLSKPIVTTADRLRDTLIHEMCHAAVWLVDNKKDGHGPFWKEWTYRARRAFPELRPINTCHSYSKNWKFLWECVSCGYTIGRMTKSFDTTRFTCGRCHGKFELKGDQKKKREANGFAKFVKENYASVKTVGTAHKDVMKQLSQKYQNQKGNPPRKSSEAELELENDDDCILVNDEEYAK